jgi:hypothetical protein
MLPVWQGWAVCFGAATELIVMSLRFLIKRTHNAISNAKEMER